MTETPADLLDRAPCGFISFGDDGEVRYINSTLLERLGYARDEVVGRHVETLFTVAGRVFLQTHFLPLVRLHGRAREVFMLLRTRDGKDVGVLCNAARRERDGEGVADCVFMEVIERRKFEDALLRARSDAEEANKAKSDFLAVMSHELRTPLNAIGGYTQLLEMEVHGPVTDAQRDALGRIDRAQRVLLRLINDVLNLARIEAGRVDYDVAPFAFAEIVDATSPMIEPQVAAKKLRLEFAVPREVRASADREKTQQILLNLLTNAVKFTGEGGLICVEAGERSSAQVFLRVTDSGMGIPPEMVRRIFEPFVQVELESAKAREGTGLGLAISRDLARGMGGDLSAESRPGVGSSFELLLPKPGD
ncbi:MAG: PAS domain-containing sensor histidine kinase [Gemmatimonadaceae bacterium]